MTTVSDLEKKILNNVVEIYSDLTSSQIFEVEESLPLEYLTNDDENDQINKDLTIINNSFIFRDILKTNKNEKYLGFLGKDPKKGNLVISTGVDINRDYSIISHKASNFPSITFLQSALDEELNRLGSIVYILIGNIQYSDQFSESVSFPNIKQVRLNYQMKDDYILEKFVLEISPHSHTIDIIDPLSDELKLTPEQQIKLKKVIDSLRRDAILPLSIPQKDTDLEETFLDEILQSLEKEISNYEKSLSEWIHDERDDVYFTDILRISYNFIDDAISLIELILSICDLKPIISWLTLKSQYELYKTFSNLDWQKEGKPSLSLYMKLIKDARNSRFHKLFRINNTIEVDLNGINLKAKYLRMFSEYKSRSSVLSNFSYEEKQLIELLLNFTRTEERKVTKRFWNQNLDIMKSTLVFISDFCHSLKLLRTL